LIQSNYWNKISRDELSLVHSNQLLIRNNRLVNTFHQFSKVFLIRASIRSDQFIMNCSIFIISETLTIMKIFLLHCFKSLQSIIFIILIFLRFVLLLSLCCTLLRNNVPISFNFVFLSRLFFPTFEQCPSPCYHRTS